MARIPEETTFSHISRMKNLLKKVIQNVHVCNPVLTNFRELMHAMLYIYQQADLYTTNNTKYLYLTLFQENPNISSYELCADKNIVP